MQLLTIIKKSILIFVFITLGIIYYMNNPQDSNLFPKCPIYSTTGLQCPGCGSQRAIHYLLHLDFIAAFKSNLLVVLSIPYLLLGFVFGQIKEPTKKMLQWRKTLYGHKAIIIILIIIVVFCVIRNIV
jgi:hypothetical protein